MDQIICASFPHTHYWYEAGILKLPAYRCKGSVVLPFSSEHESEAYIKTDGYLFICTFHMILELRGEARARSTCSKCESK